MFKHAETRGTLHTHTHTHGCLCKIIIPTILTISITSPSYSDISKETTNATCDKTTLGTASGKSTLSAQWTANRINLRWYNGETEITPSNDTAKTCTYDGGITLPENPPTKPGYYVAGWQVKQELINLASYYTYEEPDYDAEHISYKSNDGYYTSIDEFGEGDISGLNNGEWSVKFSNGTVKGKARCSTQAPTTFWNDSGIFTSDHFASSLADETGQSGAQYCWCQPTSYEVVNSGSFANVSSPSWVFVSDPGDADGCAYACAIDCAYSVLYDSYFRWAVFGMPKVVV